MGQEYRPVLWSSYNCLNYLVAFLVSFCYVGLKATQQQNVIFGEYLWIMPVSVLLALCEVTIVVLIVKSTLIVALPIGVGAGLGAIVAMWAHKRWIRRG